MSARPTRPSSPVPACAIARAARAPVTVAILLVLVVASPAGGAAASSIVVAQVLRDPAPQYIPKPTGPCPSVVDGEVTFTPAGIPPRTVRIWMRPAAARNRDGPLVFYWHGRKGSPNETLHGMGDAMIGEITAQGGIVAAPFSDPEAGWYPWFLAGNEGSEGREDDLILADEVLACAVLQHGVDLRRIHSIGMSAGGLQTAQMGFRRSGYVASVVTYSGGRRTPDAEPPWQDPTNPHAALVLHGGPGDFVSVSFQETSERYWDAVTRNGGFAAICDHGRGHVVPEDARASVWRFLQAHPFATSPSPYAHGLPASFPEYCTLRLDP